jgi:ribonuclease PH
MVGGRALLDLCYAEDASADSDLNVVMTTDGHFVEVQGTAEGNLFDRSSLDQMLDLADSGIKQLLQYQREVLVEAGAE